MTLRSGEDGFAIRTDSDCINELRVQMPVGLTFTPEALDAIAKKAIDAGTGARALRMILEKLMRELMFTFPSDPTVEEIVVTKEAVLGDLLPEVKYTKSA